MHARRDARLVSEKFRNYVDLYYIHVESGIAILRLRASYIDPHTRRRCIVPNFGRRRDVAMGDIVLYIWMGRGTTPVRRQVGFRDQGAVVADTPICRFPGRRPPGPSKSYVFVLKRRR